MTTDKHQQDVTATVTGILLAAGTERFADAEHLIAGLWVSDYPVALRQLVFMIIAIWRGAGLTEDDVKRFFTGAAFAVALDDDQDDT